MVELEAVSKVLTAGLTEVAISLGRQARMIFLIGAGLAEVVMPRGNRDWMRRKLELGVADWPAAGLLVALAAAARVVVVGADLSDRASCESRLGFGLC